MPKALRVHAPGGPEALTYEEADVGRPGPGQALIRHTAIGLNFIDVYFRTGLYPAPAGMPVIPGGDAAGVVVGSAVTAAAIGSRYYALPPACSPYPYAGFTYYSCSNVWYKPTYQGATVVYVVVPKPG